MLTKTEKGYLALTLFFLASGSGIKIWRHAHVKIGPFPDPYSSSVPAPASSLQGDSLSAILADSTSASTSAARDSVPSGFPGAVNDSSIFARRDSVSGAPSRASRGSSRGSAGGKSAFTGKVNLNRAASAELTHVKGIGEKTAEAIVQYRRAHGPFRDFRDLLQVKGIGEKKLEKLTPYLIL